jgi:peroxiredoxin
MRLEPGKIAPSFEGESLTGKTVSLEQFRGKRVLVKFYRFASCPICVLHMRELVKRTDEIRAAGLEPVVLFHSPREKLGQFFDPSLPFEMIADPDKRAFAAYGVESSILGMFSWAVMRDYMRAMWNGIFSKPFGHEGGIQGHPADFIVDERGVLTYARYGANYADTLGVDAVLALARSGSLAASVAQPKLLEV